MIPFHRSLTQRLAALALLFLHSPSQADIATGLVGWWKLNDGNAITAPDSSGNGNAFAMQGGTGPQTIAGRSGMGFDGVDEFGTNANSPFATNPFSIATWVYLESGGPSSSTLLSNGRLAITSTLVAGSSPARSSVVATIITTSGSLQLPAGELFHGGWHHVAVCHSSTQSTVYLDGQLSASGTAAASLASGFGLGIGRNPQNGSQYFRGILSDLRYYSRALTAGDVNELITGAVAPPDISTGLVGWWKMTEGSGTTVSDSSGNNNTGTIYGATWTTYHGRRCMIFDGNDRISVPDSASLTSSTITLAAWVDATAYPGEGAVIDRAGYVPGWTSMTCSLGLQNTGNSVSVDALTHYVLDARGDISSNITQDNRSITGAMAPNRWHHLVFVAGASGNKLYRNGTLLSSSPPTTLKIGNGYGLHIGFKETSNRYFTGAIRDARIYNRELTAPDALALYNADSGSAPRRLYTFDDNSLQDTSGHGVHATSPQSPRYTLGTIGNGVILAGSAYALNAGPDVRIEQASAMAFVRIDEPLASPVSQSIVSSWEAEQNFNLGWSRDSSGKNVFVAKFRKRQDATHAYAEQSAVSQSAFKVGVFNHVAMTYDGTTLRLFVNGREEASNATLTGLAETPAAATPEIAIGGTSLGSTTTSWAIDDVRVFDVALTAAELAPLASGVRGKSIYFEDFDLPSVDPMQYTWGNLNSASSTQAAATRSTRFLGPHQNATGKLMLPLLPSHTSVTVAYDLYLHGNWRGGGTPSASEDRFWTGLANGSWTTGSSTNFNTTFSTTTGIPQQFPSAGTTFANQPFTGAYETNTLGYGSDQVIRVVKTFAHTSSALALEFRRLYPLDNTNGYWSLDNVSVSVSEDSPTPSVFSLSGTVNGTNLPAGVVRLEVVSGIVVDKLTLPQAGSYSFPSLNGPQNYRVLAYVDGDADAIRDPHEWVGFIDNGSLYLDTNRTIDITISPPVDIDSDGMADEWEQTYGLVVGTNDSQLDKDGDGLNNLQEYWLGTSVTTTDTDGDDVSDGQEYPAGMNPLSLDSDGDGMTDAYEWANGLNSARNDTGEDADFDFVTNLQEFTNGTKANNALSGTDGISDYRRINGKGTWKAYYDRNNRFLGQLFDNGMCLTQGYDANSNPTRQIMRQGADYDHDGLLDLWEIANGLNPNSASGADGVGDADSDGLTNVQEFVAGTDPKSAKAKTTNDGTLIATSSAFPFTPTNYIMACGQLDGTGIEEVVISGDGDPGAATNVLRIFTPNATGTAWTEETVNVGNVGVTSICIGQAESANNIFIGTRAVAPAFGQIIKLVKSAGVWTPAVLITSSDEVAFVAGVPAGSHVLAQYSLVNQNVNRKQTIYQVDVNPGSAYTISPTTEDIHSRGPRFARDGSGGIMMVRPNQISSSYRLQSVIFNSSQFGNSRYSPTSDSYNTASFFVGARGGSRDSNWANFLLYNARDLNSSGAADPDDDTSLTEVIIGGQTRTQSTSRLFQPSSLTVATGTVFPNGASTASVLLAGDADGVVSTWSIPSSNSLPLSRCLLTGSHRGKVWHDFRSLRGIGTGDSAAGLAVAPASPTTPQIVVWSVEALRANTSAPVQQTAPMARIASTPIQGTAISPVDVDLWDAEGNTARVLLQYRPNAWSAWANATVLSLDGGSATSFVSAPPGGSRHHLLWDAAADLGAAFTGNVLLRTRATDAGDAGAWSEQMVYTVGVASEIAVTDTDTSTALTDGLGIVALGDVAQGQPVTRTFTISNGGNGDLTGLNVTSNASGALGLIITQPTSTTLATGGSTTFSISISLTPSASGSQSFALQIASNDADENPFDIPISLNAVPQVLTLAVAPSAVLEDGNGNLVFSFTRSATAGSLTVNYSLGGTATLDEDYTASASGSISFTNGNAIATVTVDPTADSAPEPDETVTLTVSMQATYFIGSPGSATGRILSDELPVLTTNSVTNITATDALSGGTVSSNGGTTIVERGIVFATAANPTTANANKVPVPGGTGAFTAAMGGLVPATTYYVRAYATNSAGTGYGQQVQFTTGTVPVGPSWQSPTGLEHSMTVYAQVDRDGARVESPGSKLAAFENSNVAGVASLITGPGGIKLYQLTVWSNNANVATMPMKVFDAGTSEVLDISETLAFASNGIIGTIAAPVLYHVRPAEVDQVIPLVQGWNWISFNALPANHAPGTVLSQYTPQDNDLIKGTLGTATHFGGVWYPTASFTLDSSRLYLLRRQAASATNLTVHGVPVDATEAINLVAGWNWLGYNPQTPRPIGTALAGVTLANNDLIKGQYDGTATYFDGQWYAPTYEMAPGRGYLLKVATAQSFAYETAPPASPAPEGGEGALAAMSEEFLPSPPPDEASGAPAASPPSWQSPVGKENSMTLYATVEIGGQRLESAPAMLAVLESGEVAGVAQVMQGPTGKLYQMTVWSNSTSVSGLTLAAYDPSIVIVRDLAPSVAFSANDIQGTITTPIVFGAPALTPRELWRHTHYGSIADAGTSADTASNNDHDGVPNLLEYATSMNPMLNDTVPMAAAKAGNSIEFIYTKNKAATDLTYTVEWSDTLNANDWSTAGVSAPSTLSDNGTTQQIKVTVPAGSGVMRRFVRLKVTAFP